MPPLRERAEDIPLLIERFFEQFAAKHKRRRKRMSAEALQLCQRFPWPGNVRQLRNVIERLVITCREVEVGVMHLPDFLRDYDRSATTFTVRPGTPLARGREAADSADAHPRHQQPRGSRPRLGHQPPGAAIQAQAVRAVGGFGRRRAARPARRTAGAKLTPSAQVLQVRLLRQWTGRHPQARPEPEHTDLPACCEPGTRGRLCIAPVFFLYYSCILPVVLASSFPSTYRGLCWEFDPSARHAESRSIRRPSFGQHSTASTLHHPTPFQRSPSPSPGYSMYAELSALPLPSTRDLLHGLSGPELLECDEQAKSAL